MTSEPTLQEMSFEALLQRLESIAERLSSDDDGLEVALSNYETGLIVARECLNRLDNAEQRVAQLKASIEGDAD